MTDSLPDLPQQVALFRYGLIAELVRLPPGTPGLYRRLEVIAAQDYAIPGSTRTRVATETLRDWLQAYRGGGFEALVPKPRSDRGTPRALTAAISEALLAIKEAHSRLSVRLVIAQAKAAGTVPADAHLPPSTVHRLFAAHGLMRKRVDEPSEQDRRRFAFERAGQLWMTSRTD